MAALHCATFDAMLAKFLETSEKDGDISKDDLDRAEKELDKLTQEHVEQIEKAFARKEQELLEV